jgi:hypothetical protein
MRRNTVRSAGPSSALRLLSSSSSHQAVVAPTRQLHRHCLLYRATCERGFASCTHMHLGSHGVTPQWNSGPNGLRTWTSHGRHPSGKQSRHSSGSSSHGFDGRDTGLKHRQMSFRALPPTTPSTRLATNQTCIRASVDLVDQTQLSRLTLAM